MNPDHSYTETLTCIGTILAGASAGGTFTTTGIEHQGRIARGRQTILFGDTNPNIETLIITLAGGEVFPSKRICNRSGTIVKMP